MIIKEDLNPNIIIYAQGEYQIELLFWMYYKISKNYNKCFIMGGMSIKDNYKDIIKSFRKDINNLKSNDIRPDLLFIPNVNYISLNSGTIFTKNKLEMYYKINKSLVKDGEISRISQKINIKDYRLINMKTFIDTMGKYIFNNNTKEKEYFINKYPELSDCNIFKTLKSIPI